MLAECLGSHRREKVSGFLWLVVGTSHPSSPAPGCTCWIHRHRAVRKSPECLGLQVGGPELGPQPVTCLPGGLWDGVSCSGGQQGAELEGWGEWSSLYLSVPVGVMTSLGTRRAILGGLGNAGHHVAKCLL